MTKYIITEQMHNKIKDVYLNQTQRGSVKELAVSLNIPICKISKYAMMEGWTPVSKKDVRWTKKELKILKSYAHYTPKIIQLKLKNNGFSRTEAAIVQKRKRKRLLSNLKGQSAHSLAECFGVDTHAITRIIKQKKLNAKKRLSNRTEKQGGDAWYIKDRDIKKYIIENIHEIDLRKVDKYWFVDILTNNIN